MYSAKQPRKHAPEIITKIIHILDAIIRRTVNAAEENNASTWKC